MIEKSLIKFEIISNLSKTKQVKLMTKSIDILFNVMILLSGLYGTSLLLKIDLNVRNREINESVVTDLIFKIDIIFLFTFYCIEIFNDLHYKIKLKWDMWIHHIISCLIMLAFYVYIPFMAQYLSRVYLSVFLLLETIPNILLDIAGIYYYLALEYKFNHKICLYKLGGISFGIFIIAQIISILIFNDDMNIKQIITIIIFELAVLPAQIYVIINVYQIINYIHKKQTVYISKAINNENDGIELLQ